MMFLAIGMAVVSLVMLVLSIGLIIVCVARKKRRNQGYRGLSEAMIAEWQMLTEGLSSESEDSDWITSCGE